MSYCLNPVNKHCQQAKKYLSNANKECYCFSYFIGRFSPVNNSDLREHDYIYKHIKKILAIFNYMNISFALGIWYLISSIALGFYSGGV